MNMRDYPSLHLDTDSSKGTACSKKGCEPMITTPSYSQSNVMHDQYIFCTCSQMYQCQKKNTFDLFAPKDS